MPKGTSIKLLCVAFCGLLFVLGFFLWAWTTEKKLPPKLETKYKLGCLSADQISSHYTPIDLLPAYEQCLQENRLEDAVLLNRIISSYIMFDAKRVTNKELIYAVDKKIVQKTFKKIFSRTREGGLRDDIYPYSRAYIELSVKITRIDLPEKHAKICANIIRIGMPTYSPTYTATPNTLEPNFNAKIAWKEILVRPLLKCPVPFTGDMTSTHNIGCIKPEEVRNQYTPVDLMRGYIQCFKENNFENAGFLHQLAVVYKDFDEARIVDGTDGDQASKALFELRDNLRNQDGFEKVDTIRSWYIDRNSQHMATVCQHVLRIGIPDYYPHYMTAEYGLKLNFDAKTAWKKAVSKNVNHPTCDEENL